MSTQVTIAVTGGSIIAAFGVVSVCMYRLLSSAVTALEVIAGATTRQARITGETSRGPVFRTVPARSATDHDQEVTPK